MTEIETRTIRKVMWRLLPFLFMAYCIAYLDRVNVGFAKLQMNEALGLSEAAYGLGAGLFFVAYFFFEVPSNLILARVGARRWLGRIMITWGIVSATFAFIAPIADATGFSETAVFYSLRLLLGVAEAGFFPGVVYYVSLWFPASYRGRALSLLTLGIPFSSILGRPISGYLMNVSSGGFQGWQWLFVLEALPAVILGVVAVFYLTDGPHKAGWLAEDERNWLGARLEAERVEKVPTRPVSMLRALADRRIILCALIYFCETMGSFGLTFFLPTIVKSFGADNIQVGFLSALPAVATAIAMVLLGRSSDRTMKRREHVILTMACAGVALGGAGFFSSPVVILAFLCVAQAGLTSTVPLLLPIPSTVLSGEHAAGGIAAVNSVGLLGGFLGPYLMGLLTMGSGNYQTGLLVFGGAALLGSLLAVMLKLPPPQVAAQTIKA